MNAAQRLHRLGQSLWLDNLSREILDDGTLDRYIREFALTGLTSNPTIFDKAIRTTNRYDRSIAQSDRALSDEAVFFGLALQDLTRAAALFRPAFDASHGADGWVSLEVSPLLADDTRATIEQAKALHARAACPNLFIKIPGNRAGVPAIEEAIAAGIPINVTLLFSTEQCLAAAGAYRRGIERRMFSR
jgi:transaldolase